MPYPKKGEPSKKFIPRFMSSPHAKKFPTKTKKGKNQRLAIAYAIMRQHGKKG